MDCVFTKCPPVPPKKQGTVAKPISSLCHHTTVEARGSVGLPRFCALGSERRSHYRQQGKPLLAQQEIQYLEDIGSAELRSLSMAR